MIRRTLIFVPIVMLLLMAAARDGFDQWVRDTQLPPLLSQTSVEVLDRNGDLLRAYTVDDGLWRLGSDPRNVDPQFIDMLIAYEDKRFCTHAGVDLWAMTRAVTQALVNGRVISGGSTLTMQVARLIEDSGTGRWQGKLRQMRVAWALEQHATKDQILALYLTHAPYGGNLEGIRAATLSWFGKEPSRLTPAQSAFLIALPQSPEGRRPDRHYKIARAARDRVLDRLVGAHAIDQDTAKSAKLETIPAEKRNFPSLAPHLSDRALAEIPESLRHDLTLDKPLQSTLERLAARSVINQQERLSIAFMVADHQTGDILASVGSAGFSDADHRAGFVDMTQAYRSPGSTLKPLIYAMGFDEGLIHPETLINDRPVRFGTYAPRNFDGQFRGEIRVADALRQSLNIPVVLLTDQIGPARLMSALRASGAQPKLPSGKAGLAVALGGVGMTMEDLVRLYAMQARGGVSIDLTWRANTRRAPETRIISRSAAWQIGHILSQMPPPAGMAHNRLAYKTGTSYGHRDAWAVGFDGRHVAAVWIGRPDGTPVPGVFGGDVAAPLLFEVFQHLKPTLDPLGPPPPETLLVSAAQLPLPLQRFRGRNAVFAKDADAPTVAFPPDNARLAHLTNGLTIKVRHGTLPLTILANGAPIATRVHRRNITLPFNEKGASTLSVIDAKGRSDRVEIWIE